MGLLENDSLSTHPLSASLFTSTIQGNPVFAKVRLKLFNSIKVTVKSK